MELCLQSQQGPRKWGNLSTKSYSFDESPTSWARLLDLRAQWSNSVHCQRMVTKEECSHASKDIHVVQYRLWLIWQMTHLTEETLKELREIVHDPKSNAWGSWTGLDIPKKLRLILINTDLHLIWSLPLKRKV